MYVSIVYTYNENRSGIGSGIVFTKKFDSSAFAHLVAERVMKTLYAFPERHRDILDVTAQLTRAAYNHALRRKGTRPWDKKKSR